MKFKPVPKHETYIDLAVICLFLFTMFAFSACYLESKTIGLNILNGTPLYYLLIFSALASVSVGAYCFIQILTIVETQIEQDQKIRDLENATKKRVR